MLYRTFRSTLMPGALIGAAIVALAAPPPASEKLKEFTTQQKRWWAFQPVVKTAPPAVRQTGWTRNEIDAFIVAKLEKNGIAPNRTADKLTLIRRASLVLTGLPPTPEKVQAFLADSSPKAFEKVVDDLLASPHYGERWARHWLDLARYADSEGFKSDETRPNVWRYRDYVIRSFNSDKPYSRFVQEQIAGDELFPGDSDALVATGFNRHFPDESNAANIMQRRQELLNDVTDTVGSTLMGLTYGCARCHDHKFDPILHKDYYRLQSFFSNTRIEDHLALDPAGLRAEFESKQIAWEEMTKPVRAKIERLVKPLREQSYRDRLTRFPEEIRQVFTMDPAERNPYQWQMFHKAKAQVTFSDEDTAGQLKGDDKKQYQDWKTELATFDALKPSALNVAQGMVDAGALAPKTHILAVGNYDSPLAEVQPGFLSILDSSDAAITPALNGTSTGRRSVLAKWLTRANNPLTARVMVNRIWHYQFGRGIAANPSDFGVMGDRPTHRELLDTLTARFIEEGWSMKKMHKRIMLSSTWQQSSASRKDAIAADPDNKLLWRYNRRRLEGEIIRDSMLQVSGLLNPKMYGPGVFPSLPPGMVTRGWKSNEEQPETLRRSIYTFVRRNTRYPMFEAFDMPDTHESCARRDSTVSSSQALELLNNELVVGWSRELAAKISNDSGLTPGSQIERAWRLVYSRMPSAEESLSAAAFLDRQTRVTGGDRQAAFADLCHMLLNSNEFVYLN